MNVTLVRSKRKTISIQVNPDATVVVRAPKRMSLREINAFVEDKKPWIEKHVNLALERIRQNESLNITPLSADDIEELARRALEVMPKRVEYYAKIIGVSYNRVTIRCQKTRWGSCSAKGNINLNCLLMLAPVPVMDYVIVHELCHRLEMNHSKAFWHEVAKYIPDYKKHVKWLRNEGRIVNMRVRK